MNTKFQDKYKTAKGEDRAFVELKEYQTLWFNTGTQCNLSCKNCYIESTPQNDRLSFITDDEVKMYLKEIKENKYPISMIGLTGGEPFLNPHIIKIINNVLSENLEILILTNALNLIKRHHEDLIALKDQYGDKLSLRVSLDHHTQEIHENERGKNTFDKTMQEFKFLHDQGFNLSLASRSLINEDREESIRGHNALLKEYNIDLDLDEKIVIFPEMKSGRDLPEITTECWGILNKNPDDQMCATERMVVKRKGEQRPSVMPCTLLAYDDEFILGHSLKEADKKVYLNHPFCAEFCVLGGASCSSTK
jgi:sulfatase maturation enzyme AslB (radical SAM superfamily)